MLYENPRKIPRTGGFYCPECGDYHPEDASAEGDDTQNDDWAFCTACGLVTMSSPETGDFLGLPTSADWDRIMKTIHPADVNAAKSCGVILHRKVGCTKKP